MVNNTAEIVAAAVEHGGRSINGLATETGIPFSTLRRKLRGQAEYNLSDLVLIADALNIDPADLLPPEFRKEVA